MEWIHVEATSLRSFTEHIDGHAQRIAAHGSTT